MSFFRTAVATLTVDRIKKRRRAETAMVKHVLAIIGKSPLIGSFHPAWLCDRHGHVREAAGRIALMREPLRCVRPRQRIPLRLRREGNFCGTTDGVAAAQ